MLRAYEYDNVKRIDLPNIPRLYESYILRSMSGEQEGGTYIGLARIESEESHNWTRQTGFFHAAALPHNQWRLTFSDKEFGTITAFTVEEVALFLNTLEDMLSTGLSAVLNALPNMQPSDTVFSLLGKKETEPKEVGGIYVEAQAQMNWMLPEQGGLREIVTVNRCYSPAILFEDNLERCKLQCFQLCNKSISGRTSVATLEGIVYDANRSPLQIGAKFSLYEGERLIANGVVDKMI